jgi:tRNA dimethylallyltransferase
MHQTKTPNYTPCYIWCTKPREQLYQDIDNRVDHMIKNGWFEEVNHIIQHTPAYQHLNAFKAIGYLSIARGLLNPQIEIDVNKIKQQTRQYAKRQITWIRHHYPDVYVYDQNNISGVLKHIKTWLDR